MSTWRLPPHSDPVRRLEPHDWLEVLGVVGDQGHAERQRMSRDERVERADGLTAPRQRIGDRCDGRYLFRRRATHQTVMVA